MSLHDPLVSVLQMLNHSREAIAMVDGRCRKDLDQDRMLNLSLVRLMEIVGEAATRVPEEFRAEHAGVPWREVSDLRNRLIHGYDSINFDILWEIVGTDLPILVAQLETVLSKVRE